MQADEHAERSIIVSGHNPAQVANVPRIRRPGFYGHDAPLRSLSVQERDNAIHPTIRTLLSLTPKRYPVTVTVGGHTYRTTVVMYNGKFMVPLSAENREAAGVEPHQEVEVEMELDTAPREVEVPDDLAEAFVGQQEARAFFETLSNSNKKAYTLWIESAKKDETRRERVAKAIVQLSEGRTLR